MNHLSIERIIANIKSGSPEIIYSEVTGLATLWAASGFLNQSNRLLEILWKYKFKHSADVWLNDQGLQMLWDISGTYPENIPFKFVDLQEVQAENWNRHFLPYWNQSPVYVEGIKGKHWSELTGHVLKMHGIAMAFDETNAAFMATPENCKEAIKALEQYLAIENPLGHSLKDVLVCLIILTARIGAHEQTGVYISQWGKAYHQFWPNTSVTFLMRDAAVAEILLKGKLAESLLLSHEICERGLTDIQNAFEERISAGQTNIYDDLKWTDILERISEAIYNKSESNDKNNSKKWLGNSPATLQQIKAAELRLNTHLPKEYIQFLKASNGFDAFELMPELLPINKIDWLKNCDPELVEIWCDEMQEFDEFTSSLRSSLLIGGLNDEQQVLLIPSKSKKDWECWFFASWIPGEQSYRNFRYFMENQLLGLVTIK
jgi:SMI1 / KNR4 family (SUKH-1)